MRAARAVVTASVDAKLTGVELIGGDNLEVLGWYAVDEGEA